MANGSLTWLGHASFRLDTPGGKRIYVDPWLSGPTCPETEKTIERIDAIVLTHGHSDHASDVPGIAKEHGCPVIAIVELRGWVAKQMGAELDMTQAINKGGTARVAGLKVTLTNAFHSSSSNDGDYLGEAAGVVIELEDGRTIYFAGDTCVFGDMELIGRIYKPALAVIPIGDHFTMGPREAAVALDLLGVDRCVPCHWGTFSLLTGTPDELARLAPGVTIERIEPGDTVEL